MLWQITIPAGVLGFAAIGVIAYGAVTERHPSGDPGDAGLS
jgi:hypothetical protein